jgi:hypothetical protein
MKIITKNIYEILMWGIFASIITLGGYVFANASIMVSAISAM